MEKSNYKFPPLTILGMRRFLKTCRTDSKGNPFVAVHAVKGIGIMMLFLAVALAGMTSLMLLGFADDEIKELSLLFYLVSLWVFVIGIVSLRYRVRLTDTHLERRFIFTKRIPVSDISGYQTAGTVVFILGSKGQKIRLEHASCLGGAHFIQLLEERTGVAMFSELTKIPKDLDYQNRKDISIQ